MAEYYNKTRTPLAVKVGKDRSIVIGSKQRVYIPASGEGDSSLSDLVRKGFLVRIAVSREAPVVVEPEKVQETQAVPIPLVTLVAEAKSDPVPIATVASAGMTENSAPETGGQRRKGR
jgi:hypothetical protein